MPHDDKPADIDPVAKDIIRRKARYLKRRGGFTSSDLPDLEQDLALHLLKRMPTFDSQQADWSTFVAAIVTAWGANLLRNRHAAKRNYLRTRPLPAATERGEGDNNMADEILSAQTSHSQLGRQRLSDHEQRERELDIEEALQHLPPELRLIADRLKYLPIAELARELGIPRTTLYELLRRIRWRFQKMGLGKKTNIFRHLGSAPGKRQIGPFFRGACHDPDLVPL